MLLADLIDPDLLARMLGEGFIRRREHPDLPLDVLNYAEKAQYEGEWNPATTACRGLIVNRDTGQVVARPWAKFFNHGQGGLAAAISLDEPVEVTDKMDGSLGVLYPTGDGRHAIATRGSFTSDQALHATELYQQRYADAWRPDPKLTYLFEIVYPDNRIVCDYGDTDDLLLLGAVTIGDGLTYGPGMCWEWPGKATATLTYRSLAGALAAEPRAGAEGIVVRALDGIEQRMVKIKQADYVALHRLVTGLNARVVWERLRDGDSVQDICTGLPDEFHGWVRQVAGRLEGQQAAILEAARAELDRLHADPAVVDRKSFAAAAQQSDLRPWLFLLYDGKDPSGQVWRTLRPSGMEVLVAHGEDVA